MAYLGSWRIGDTLEFMAQTHRFDTGAQTDADSVPTYRVYENSTTTPILTGSMTFQDSGNTDGFYTGSLSLTAANGFERGKNYTIRKQATVNSVIGAAFDTFQIEAAINAQGIRKNVAYNGFQFVMAASGLTVTLQRSIDGGAFAAIGAPLSITNISGSKAYTFNLVASDLNGNTILFWASASGQPDSFFTIKTVEP